MIESFLLYSQCILPIFRFWNAYGQRAFEEFEQNKESFTRFLGEFDRSEKKLLFNSKLFLSPTAVGLVMLLDIMSVTSLVSGDHPVGNRLNEYVNYQRHPLLATTNEKYH